MPDAMVGAAGAAGSPDNRRCRSRRSCIAPASTPKMKTYANPKPSMNLLATLLASSAFVVGCGGGGGAAAGATSGSQSVTPIAAPTTSAAPAASEAASGAAAAGSAGSAVAATGGAAGASDPAAETAAAKSGSDFGTQKAGSTMTTGGSATPKPTATLPAAGTNIDTSLIPPSSATGGANSQVVAAVTPPPAEALTTPAPAPAELQMRLDRLKAAVASMKVSQHEAKPACSPCAGWGVKPITVMGTEPYASSLPSNWPGVKFAEWKAMLGWFVIYEGANGNTAKNTAVEVGSIEMWYLSKSTKTWRLVQSGLLPAWDSTVAPDAVSLSSTSALRVASKASVTYVPTATNVVHGGLPQTHTPWNTASNQSEIDAIYLSVRHRLTLRNPSDLDDRESANYVLEAGVDYYPYMGARVSDLKAPYVPGAGLGQFIKVTSQWRHSTLFLKSPTISEAQIFSIQPPTFIY